MTRWTARQRACAFLILTVVELGWCVGLTADGGRLGGAGASAEFTANGQTTIPLTGVGNVHSAPTTPCDIVTGCVAAHSVRRQLVASYNGNLFQLSRTGGGGGTQNIGMVGGVVDKAAINTFCGSNNANSCAYHIIYDQSGNGNDVTAVGGDVPFTFVGSWGTAPVPSVTFGTALHYFNNASPTGLATGDNDKSLVIVANDAQFSDCCGLYGQAHDISVTSGTDPCGVVRADFCGTDLLLGLRASKGSGQGNANCRRLFVDLEEDVSEQCYAVDVSGGDTNLAAYQAQSSVGDLVGAVTYTASTNHVALNWNDIYKSDLAYVVGLSCDSATPKHCDNEIRVGAGGDASTVFGVWYEGLIYAKVISGANQTTLIANAQTAYSITLSHCTDTVGSETVINTVGEANLSAAWGLRLENPHLTGPLGVIQDNTTSGFHIIKPSGCTIDTGDIATFLGGHTGGLVALDNQVMTGRNWITASPTTDFTTAHLDPWREATGATGATYTTSCAGSFSCATFTTSNSLGGQSAVSWPTPYSLLVVGSNTGSSFSAILISGANFHPYLGSTGAANSLLFQATDSGGVSCTSCATNGTTFVFGAVAVASTHDTMWINGSSTDNASVPAAVNSSVALKMGTTPFAGTIFESAVSIGQDLSTNMSALSTKLRNYWGI